MLAPTFIDRLIDSYVTPELVATINRNNRSNTAAVANSAPKGLNEAFQAGRLRWEQVRYAFFSGGPLYCRKQSEWQQFAVENVSIELDHIHYPSGVETTCAL
jgi:hypothetical protein